MALCCIPHPVVFLWGALQDAVFIIAAERRCFSTLLPVVATAGLRCVQFDRQGGLLAAAGAAGSAAAAAEARSRWEDAMQQALGVGRCVLVQHKHLACSQFPVGLFSGSSQGGSCSDGGRCSAVLIEYTSPRPGSSAGLLAQHQAVAAAFGDRRHTFTLEVEQASPSLHC
jgi:hypothetical protein